MTVHLGGWAAGERLTAADTEEWLQEQAAFFTRPRSVRAKVCVCLEHSVMRFTCGGCFLGGMGALLLARLLTGFMGLSQGHKRLPISDCSVCVRDNLVQRATQHRSLSFHSCLRVALADTGTYAKGPVWLHVNKNTPAIYLLSLAF